MDVPKLEIPKIQEWTAPSGNKYLIERNLDEISGKIMDAPAIALEALGAPPVVVETNEVTSIPGTV